MITFAKHNRCELYSIGGVYFFGNDGKLYKLTFKQYLAYCEHTKGYSDEQKITHLLSNVEQYKLIYDGNNKL
jgi:hypothetical protein